MSSDLPSLLITTSLPKANLSNLLKNLVCNNFHINPVNSSDEYTQTQPSQATYVAHLDTKYYSVHFAIHTHIWEEPQFPIETSLSGLTYPKSYVEQNNELYNKTHHLGEGKYPHYPEKKAHDAHVDIDKANVPIEPNLYSHTNSNKPISPSLPKNLQGWLHLTNLSDKPNTRLSELHTSLEELEFKAVLVPQALSEPPTPLEKWANKNYIEIIYKVDTGENDPPSQENLLQNGSSHTPKIRRQRSLLEEQSDGIDRIIEVLECHIWPGHIRNVQKKPPQKATKEPIRNAKQSGNSKITSADSQTSSPAHIRQTTSSDMPTHGQHTIIQHKQSQDSSIHDGKGKDIHNEQSHDTHTKDLDNFDIQTQDKGRFEIPVGTNTPKDKASAPLNQTQDTFAQVKYNHNDHTQIREPSDTTSTLIEDDGTLTKPQMQQEEAPPSIKKGNKPQKIIKNSTYNDPLPVDITIDEYSQLLEDFMELYDNTGNLPKDEHKRALFEATWRLLPFMGELSDEDK